MVSAFSQWLKQRCLSTPGKKHQAGFTLIELLVAMIIGGMITSALLFLVVELLKTNHREAARSDTQRETQMALDYIARDLREAVYVYDGNCLVSSSTGLNTQPCPGLLNALPSNIAGTGRGSKTLPVLAFWKADELPTRLKDNCTKKASDFSRTNGTLSPEVTGVPCISRRMYTLVVYTLDWGDSNTWQGKARIKRYKLPQFTDSAGDRSGQPPITKGWAYPAGEDTGFQHWPKDKDGNTLRGYVPPETADSSSNQVLLDFVDMNGVANPTCPDPIGKATGNPPVYNPGYVMTPDSSLANSSKRGFHVCVKGGESYGNLNQEVVIRIQGNAAGKPGLSLNKNVLVPVETRVLTRGVLNKNI